MMKRDKTRSTPYASNLFGVALSGIVFVHSVYINRCLFSPEMPSLFRLSRHSSSGPRIAGDLRCSDKNATEIHFLSLPMLVSHLLRFSWHQSNFGALSGVYGEFGMRACFSVWIKDTRCVNHVLENVRCEDDISSPVKSCLPANVAQTHI